MEHFAIPFLKALDIIFSATEKFWFESVWVIIEYKTKLPRRDFGDYSEIEQKAEALSSEDSKEMDSMKNKKDI